MAQRRSNVLIWQAGSASRQDQTSGLAGSAPSSCWPHKVSHGDLASAVELEGVVLLVVHA
jgi:hypothetical protein